MCVCFTLLEDFSTLLNHNLATTTTTTTTSTTTPCFCYSPAGVNIQEFSDLLLSYQSAISTVFDLLQIIIILLQKFSFFSKEGHVRGKQGARGFGYIATPFGLRFSPFHCKTSVMFLWLFFRYKTRYQRSEVIGPLWPCVAESPKKINYKKNYEDDFAHYCYYCCYCPPILFSKKIKKNAYLFSPPNEYCFFFFLLLCTYLTLTSWQRVSYYARRLLLLLVK